MRDQIAAAGRAGLRAATVNSTNVDEWGEVLGDVRAGRIDVLLISPERLSNPSSPASCPTCSPPWACWSSMRPTASPTGASTSGPTTSG
jgi:superfamily II DNA helicase RecQ